MRVHFSLMQFLTLFHEGFRSSQGMRDPGWFPRPWSEASPCTAQSLKGELASLCNEHQQKPHSIPCSILSPSCSHSLSTFRYFLRLLGNDFVLVPIPVHLSHLTSQSKAIPLPSSHTGAFSWPGESPPAVALTGAGLWHHG